MTTFTDGRGFMKQTEPAWVMRWPLAALLPMVLAGCATSAPDVVPTYQPAPGINEVLRGEIEAAEGHEVVMGDLVLAPDGTIPPHYHHGEEFIYVLGGSTTIERAGYPTVTLHAGESLRVAPGVVHSGRNGPGGARVVSVWIKPVDRPLRVPVTE